MKVSEILRLLQEDGWFLVATRGSHRQFKHSAKLGRVLMEEFLKPMAISQYRLAKEISVPAQRVGDIVAGKRGVTADTDLRLCRFFGLSNGYWLRAQAAYDTEVAERTIGPKLVNIKPWASHVAEQTVATDARKGARR